MVDRQVTETAPWIPQGNRLQDIWSAADALYGQMPGYYPGQTTVGFSPQTELGLGLTQQRALAGSPYEQALGHYLTNTLGQGQINLGGAAQGAQGLIGGLGQGQSALGQIAGGGQNPYLDQMFQGASRGLGTQFRENVLPGVAAQFGAAGRTGSGAHQGAVGRATEQYGTALGDLASQIYGGAYDADQGRRLAAAQSLQTGGLGGIGAVSDIYGNIGQQQARAAALTPQAQALEYGNIDRLLGVGGRVEDLAGQQLQSDIDRYNYYQQIPYQQLQDYAGLVGQQPWGGHRVTTGQAGGPSRGQAALGGALSGAGLGAQFGGGYGALVGGAVGGLGGLIFGG